MSPTCRNRAYFLRMNRATAPRTVSPERMTSGDHACLGFDDDNARWKVRAAFAEAGLFRGEQVIFFADAATTTVTDTATARARARATARATTRATATATATTTTTTTAAGVGAGAGAGVGGATHAEETVDHLLSQGLSAAATALDRGQILVLPDWPPDWGTLTDNALRNGYLGIRATGDMSWCARPGVGVGPAELVDYEAGLTPVLAGIGVTAICEYDRRLFSPDVLGLVAAAHPASVERLDALRVRRTERVLYIDGEADLATSADFEYALRLGPPPELLDLTGLTFMDARCAGLVVRLAAAAAVAAGGNATARGPLVVRCSPLVARTLRLCGAEMVPQLDVREESRR